jgi:type II secretory pathway pseudopilin PulG
VFGIAGLASKKSDNSKALAEMHKIRNALEEYRLQFGTFPPSLNNINTKMDEPFKSTKLIDPWGRSYIYSNNSAYAYTLISAGPKTTDNSDDIDSASGNF